MLLGTFTGCSGYDVLQYKIPSTGEMVSVRIDKSDGFALAANEDGTFTITQDDAPVAIGVLMPPEKMQKMRTNAATMKTCEILEEGSQDNLDFLLLKIITNGQEEWVCLVSIDGMEAGLALNSSISKDALGSCLAAIALKESPATEETEE